MSSDTARLNSRSRSVVFTRPTFNITTCLHFKFNEPPRLFSSGDLHFGEIASNVFHLSCLAQHPQTCVAWEQCQPPLVNTGKACKWNNFDSLQGAKPIKKQNGLKDIFGRQCWSALMLVWTFQPSSEIGMDTSWTCVTFYKSWKVTLIYGLIFSMTKLEPL